MTSAADVVAAAQELHARGLNVSTLGNTSIRAAGGIWITPTRVHPKDMRTSDVVFVDGGGRASSALPPSVELPLHLMIYRRHPDVAAVVHTHSPWATAWSHTGRALDARGEELPYHGIEQIPCSQKGPAASMTLAAHAAECLRAGPVVLLANHGVVATGASLRDAIEMAALAEQQAHVHWLLEGPTVPGRPPPLSDGAILRRVTDPPQEPKQLA